MKTSQLPKDNEDDEYAPLFKQYFEVARKRLAASEIPAYQTSDQVADCVINVVNSDNPPLRVRTSEWANAFCQLKTQVDPTGNKSVAAVYQLFLTPETDDISV